MNNSLTARVVREVMESPALEVSNKVWMWHLQVLLNPTVLTGKEVLPPLLVEDCSLILYLKAAPAHYLGQQTSASEGEESSDVKLLKITTFFKSLKWENAGKAPKPHVDEQLRLLLVVKRVIYGSMYNMLLLPLQFMLSKGREEVAVQELHIPCSFQQMPLCTNTTLTKISALF